MSEILAESLVGKRQRSGTGMREEVLLTADADEEVLTLAEGERGER
jgi:hypothetical protein